MSNTQLHNSIPSDQNTESGLILLKARQQCYAWATRLQITQIVITVLVPMAATIIAIQWSESRPYVATTALFVLLFDLIFLDRWQKKIIGDAAKHAEAFDCFVLKLPWNEFLCGNKHAPEKTSRAASAFPDNEKSRANLRDWYPPVVGEAPIQYARLACQRSNLWYDAELRGRYANIVMIFPVLLAVLFLVVGLVGDLPFSDLVLSIAVPATPILLWSIRERFRHGDTALAQKALMGTTENLWKEMKSSELEPEFLLSKSREFQDAIFQRRQSNPLIFPLVYRYYRPSMEDEMNIGAAERLQELLS